MTNAQLRDYTLHILQSSDAIDYAKEGLGLTETTYDNFFTMCANIIVAKILDSINCDDLPDNLIYLVVEFLIEQYKLNQDGVAQGTTIVTGASDNGQSVNFATLGTNAIRANADKFLDDNEISLAAYRKIRW